ncbi:MAG: high light inducible protein [Okeania sp. SIO3H1]|uniref:chlorophyll a/b-binding protein n=1 Tax=Okeania sp. SIO1I7 TaxID=2607772 RepID=UPI0013C56A31|nr:chlorophyll a/b-binding protein [Okeania sp. SIO1I7]NEN88925.1 high light inducible protein [Okeania sp. SIO3H1]NET25145.1 high light inducible protein [Okeania sp. SIO1I7]
MSENLTSKSTSESTQKVKTAKSNEPAFGWNTYAERINGRFAMVGFFILLLLELFTHQDFFSWLGLR